MRTIQDTITLQDAFRLNGPAAFNLMIKPAGSLCNLNCSYCYYLDKAEIYGGREPRMSEADLERYIRTYLETCGTEEVTFNWHGGEPLILGLDFFRKAVELEKRHAGEKKVNNTIQTNGTLITSEWARFLSEEHFLVGVSIDGPREIHDRFRKDKGGRPTFDNAVRGIRTMYDGGVDYNLMSTISSASEGHGLEVYHFLKSLGSRYIQFSPVVEHVIYPERNGRPDKHARPHIVDPKQSGAQLAPWSVSPLGFGNFICDIFDEWVRKDVGEYFVNFFDCTLANWCGVMPGTCSFAETCGGNAIVEHNGDVYCCDHFVYPSYKLGNLYTDRLEDMMSCEKMVRFGIDKRNALPRKCLNCEVAGLCHGGCPKHRFNGSDKGQYGMNALCEGYRKFFTHSTPVMKKMRALLEDGKAPAMVMLDYSL